MPVDKFGVSSSSATGGGAQFISTAGLVNKTGDTMTGILSAGGFQITSVGEPTKDTDAVNRAYADSKDNLHILKSGDTLTGSLYLSGNDNTVLGCTNLTTGKGFSLALGNLENVLQFQIVPDGRRQSPLMLQTSHGLFVRAGDRNVCHLGNIMTISSSINMNNMPLSNLLQPSSGQDAATKSYVDSSAVLKSFLKTATGTIPSTPVRDYTLCTFPAGKNIANGKICITELWVERGTNEWFAASCARFNKDWEEFHRMVRGSSFIVWFRSLNGTWRRNFILQYIELP
jgi:hypothetical protein